MKLELIDYSILVLYFLVLIGIGLYLKRRVKTGNDLLMSRRLLPFF